MPHISVLLMEAILPMLTYEVILIAF